MSHWVKLVSTTISKQWPAVDNDLSNPQLSRINTKFGRIEKKLFKCDNWSKELFSWMIGKKLCIQMRHLVQWNVYLDDWNEAGETFETEARVPLLPNDTSTGDNRSSTFRPFVVSMTFWWSVVSTTFRWSDDSMTFWRSVVSTTCRPFVSTTFGSFVRRSSGRRLRFRNIRTRFLILDRSAKLPFSGRTIRIDFPVPD